MALLAVILLVVAVFNLNTSANNVPVVPLNVVAGEDFWGSLVSQLGGSKVNVTSIVTDPNADPHEYESSTTDARNFALANYVILNGAGYDSWGDELLSSSPDASRKVLNVATLLGEKVGDNPHFWYSPGDVNRVVNQMKNDLIALDPRDKSYFESRAMKLNSALSTYQQTIAAIKDKYRGTKVAATEDIFTYLAQAAGLDLISPTAFTQAVAEGNDPPADAVVQFEQQLTSSSVKLLVYNKQTITPLTNSMKQLAIAHHIPVVGVSEIIEPQGITFEQWMNNQVMSIKQALDKEAGAPGSL
jgi:zinc/manganese transport system substrate-binding protein